MGDNTYQSFSQEFFETFCSEVKKPFLLLVKRNSLPHIDKQLLN